jgi:DNA repair protein RadC
MSDFVRDVLGQYRFNQVHVDEPTVLAAAEDILRRRLERMGKITAPQDASEFARARIGGLDHEEFHAMWLDNRHRIIDCDRLFNGTIDGAQVHPREIVRTAIRRNAAAVIFFHNHPSGIAEPSAADRAITRRLVDALALIDIRVLDHLVVGERVTSFAERGLL